MLKKLCLFCAGTSYYKRKQVSKKMLLSVQS
jgi:hypothetical protein